MEAGTSKKRLKGVYLVPDPLMMKPHFGPSEHIKVGLRELKKYFDIELLVLGKYEEHQQVNGKTTSLTKGVATNNGFVGMLRDVKLLWKSNKGRRSLKNELETRKIDFVYERGQYLDLRGVLAAKELGIKHFYEVNWLNFLGIRQFYRSWFNHFARRIEEYSYGKSTLNFFIGTQHKLIKVAVEKVDVIQNGIHDSIVHANEKHENQVSGKIKICYVANLMPHHRFDIFLDALNIAPEVNERFELHLVGYNFEAYSNRIPDGLAYHLHGPMKKEELPLIIARCNIGLISGGPSYSSFMKLFEYAAYKLCVVCPDLENIRLMFNSNEILYFKTDNAASLAAQLREISTEPSQIAYFGRNIYAKVKASYTWEKIYKGVSDKIGLLSR